MFKITELSERHQPHPTVMQATSLILFDNHLNTRLLGLVTDFFF